MNQRFVKVRNFLGNGFFILFAVILVFLFIHLRYYSVVQKPVSEDRKAHVYSTVYSYFSSNSTLYYGYYDFVANCVSENSQNIFQCEDSLYSFCKFLCDSLDVDAAMIELRPGYIPEHKGEFIPSYINGNFVDQSLLPSEQRLFPERVINKEDWVSGINVYLQGPFFSPAYGRNILLINVPCADKYGTYAIFSVAIDMDVENKRLIDSNPYKGGMSYIVNNNDRFIFNPETIDDVPAVEWLVNKYGSVASDLIYQTFEDEEPHFTDFTEDSIFNYACYDYDNETLYFYSIPSKLLLEDVYDVCRTIIFIALLGALIIALICILNILIVSKIRSRESAIQKDVETASKIQKSMLEDRSRSTDTYDIDAVLIPARHIGGDLYCYIKLEDRLYFCVGDVAGKGITAAMHMSKCISLFRNIIRHSDNAGDITSQLNKEMCVNNSECIFVTFFVGILDLKSGRVDYCNAGHEKPLYWNGVPGDKPYYVDLVSENIALGVMDDFEFVSGEFTMQKDSILVQYTDGVDESINENRTLFGKNRFLETFSVSLSDNVRNVNDSILNGVRHFAGNAEQSDDITLLTLKFKNEI